MPKREKVVLDLGVYEGLLQEIHETIDDVMEQVDILNTAMGNLTKHVVTLKLIAGGLGEPPRHGGMFIDAED